jgi:hypothetical protein
MEAAESALLRQHRLWVAFAVAALCVVVGSAIALPVRLAENKESAAEFRGLKEEVNRRSREAAEEARQELEKEVRLKQLEEEYWRSKRGRPE